MFTPRSHAHLIELGELLAQDGPGRHEDALLAVARAARAQGVALTAAAVLADRASPEVVRQRAFAVVVAALVGAAEREAERPLVYAAA